jgi:hypothetical protein
MAEEFFDNTKKMSEERENKGEEYESVIEWGRNMLKGLASWGMPVHDRITRLTTRKHTLRYVRGISCCRVTPKAAAQAMTEFSIQALMICIGTLSCSESHTIHVPCAHRPVRRLHASTYLRRRGPTPPSPSPSHLSVMIPDTPLPMILRRLPPHIQHNQILHPHKQTTPHNTSSPTRLQESRRLAHTPHLPSSLQPAS